MFVKVEPSGCCVRKDMVQVQLCFYLEQGDYKYHVHHVKLPVIPEGGYPGEVDDMGRPLDFKDYKKWLEGLPQTKQVNSFHNHFIYVEPDITDAEIMDIGEACLKEVYADWASDKTPNPKNKPYTPPGVKIANYLLTTKGRLKACEVKVQHLKDTVLERKV